jgi:hypothetical protein
MCAPEPAEGRRPAPGLHLEICSQRRERGSTIVTSNQPFEEGTSAASDLISQLAMYIKRAASEPTDLIKNYCPRLPYLGDSYLGNVGYSLFWSRHAVAAIRIHANVTHGTGDDRNGQQSTKSLAAP